MPVRWLQIQKWLQIIGGFIIVLIGVPLGRVCTELYIASRGEDTCFLVVGFLGIIYGNMRYTSMLRSKSTETILTLISTIGMGFTIWIGATLSHHPLLGLELAGAYFASLFIVICMRYAKGERPQIGKWTKVCPVLATPKTDGVVTREYRSVSPNPKHNK